MNKKIRTYSTEFKAEAVKKISDNNGNISATAKQLGIAMQLAEQSQSRQACRDWAVWPWALAVIEENKCLKRQLKVAEEEREILNEEG